MTAPGRRWNRFWFGGASPVPLALFRSAFGLVVLLYALQITGPFLDYFGNAGIVSPGLLHEAIGGPVLQLLPPALSDRTLMLALAGLWVAAGALTVGFKTRAAAIAVFLLVASLCHRNLLLLSSAETLMRVTAFAMMFLPRDLPFSVDWAIRKARGEVAWPPKAVVPAVQRIIAVQVAVVYLTTLGIKLQGHDWIDGTAAYYANRLLAFRNPYFPLPLDDMALVNLATYATLISEFCVATLAWFPQTRIAALSLGLVLHLAIAWNMHLWFFSAVMVASYLCFMDGADTQKALAFLHARFGPERRALAFFDGACGFCVKTRRALGALDAFDAIRWRDFRAPGALDDRPEVDRTACEHALQLSLPGNRRVLAGFGAFRWLAGRIPALWPLVPLLYLPGAGWIGDRVYAWIAARRFALGCSTEGAACPLQPVEPTESPLVR